MQRIITGIGSRSVESMEDVKNDLINIGNWCKQHDIWVRSGHAGGADYAFEVGAQHKCIAYLPWKNFNKDFEPTNANLYVLPDDFKKNKHLIQLINDFHPAPDKLSHGGLRLMARNCYQVLGKDLNAPSSAVVCWTPQERLPSGHIDWKGGTGFACRLATSRDIPILNMYEKEWQNVDDVIARLGEIVRL